MPIFLQIINERRVYVEKIITIRYDSNDVVYTDNQKMVAFYLEQGEQVLYTLLGNEKKLLFAFSKIKTAESFKKWTENKPKKNK